MMRDWLTDQAQVVWAIAATLLFFSLFAGVMIWVFRPGSRRQYREAERLPLDDGQSPGRP
jgi:cbb3-type cytochrome oxidase subunit 3